MCHQIDTHCIDLPIGQAGCRRFSLCEEKCGHDEVHPDAQVYVLPRLRRQASVVGLRGRPAEPHEESVRKRKSKDLHGAGRAWPDRRKCVLQLYATRRNIVLRGIDNCHHALLVRL